MTNVRTRRFWRHTPMDPVAEQLRDLERQGSGMASLAHLAAFALVIVFSAGSLVALSGEALTHLIASAARGALDVPAAISIAVSTLLVIAMDIALVVAAATVRMLRVRRQDGAGLHIAVIVGVSIVEAATYGYMSWLYDHPAGVALWLLISARAISAPLVAVYLSLARSLPISARDILAQVELATGRGVVRDMVRVAGDPNAPLERKLALYHASSVMSPADEARLDALIAEEQATRTILATGISSNGNPSPEQPPNPPRPFGVVIRQLPPDESPDNAVPPLSPHNGNRPSAQESSGRVTPFTVQIRTRPKSTAIRRRDRAAREALESRRRERAFTMLERDPDTSANAIAKALRCRHERAAAYKVAWQRQSQRVAR